MAFITVFEHLKFGKKATMNWTTNWGQFVVAKHDTKIQTVITLSSKDSKNKTHQFFVNLAQRWQHIRWNNNAGGNKVSSHISDTLNVEMITLSEMF